MFIYAIFLALRVQKVYKPNSEEKFQVDIFSSEHLKLGLRCFYFSINLKLDSWVVKNVQKLG